MEDDSSNRSSMMSEKYVIKHGVVQRFVETYEPFIDHVRMQDNINLTTSGFHASSMKPIEMKISTKLQVDGNLQKRETQINSSACWWFLDFILKSYKKEMNFSLQHHPQNNFR